MEPLKGIYLLKKEENEQELLFVKNIIRREVAGYSDLEILDVIDWWKKKVKYKRSLQDDPAKAMRMIVKKLQNIFHKRLDN